MTAELVAGLVAILVALIGGSVGWQQVKAHGAETERRKEAQRDSHETEARLETASKPPASPAEASAVLRRRLARVARRLERMRKSDRGRE